MSAVLKFESAKKRLFSPRERWLYEVIRSEREGREREADDYARRIADLQLHSRRLGEIALTLQEEAEKRAREAIKASVDKESFEQRFQRLADQWRRETKYLSSVTQMAMHPAYQKIIGMGQKAVPLILREMQQRGGHWLWALHVITDEDPAPPNATFKQAVQAWLEWGKQQESV